MLIQRFKLIRFIIFAAVFFEAIIASAKIEKKDCPTLEASTKHMPDNSDQSKLDWCFAFAAADILSDLHEVKLSPYDIAAHYFNHPTEIEKNRKYKTEHPSGGFLEQTIFAVKSKTICQEKDTSHLNSDWKKMSEEIIEFTADVKKITTKPKCENESKLVGLVRSLEPLMAELSSPKRLITLFDSTCREKAIPMKHENWRSFGRSSLKETEEVLDYKVNPEIVKKGVEEALGKGRPLAIEFNFNMIVQMNAGHVATLIGQKYHNGRCEMIIRNNQGPRCDPKLAGGVRCVNGTYFVEKGRAMKSIISGTWFEK